VLFSLACLGCRECRLASVNLVSSFLVLRSPACIIDGGRTGLYSHRLAGEQAQEQIIGRATIHPTAGRGRRGRCCQKRSWHSQPKKLIPIQPCDQPRKSPCLTAKSQKNLWHDQRVRRCTCALRRTASPSSCSVMRITQARVLGKFQNSFTWRRAFSGCSLWPIGGAERRRWPCAPWGSVSCAASYG
jgi:hypothetical protein